jgi:predicted metalloprotease
VEITVNARSAARVRLIAGCALAALVAGCFRLPSDEGSGSNPSGAPSAGVPSAGASASTRSLEGAFGYDQMKAYLDAVLKMITQWSAATWPNIPEPERILYVRHGATGREGCETSSGRLARFTSRSYEYCGGDKTIYVGQDMLWTLYEDTGDAGPAVGLAHEWGHHIQEQLGVAGPQSAQEAIALEDQADCLAGAWTQYTNQQGRLELPDDIEDIDKLFPLIGSAEGPDRDHGTAAERMRAWQNGFDGGVPACGLPQ